MTDACVFSLTNVSQKVLCGKTTTTTHVNPDYWVKAEIEPSMTCRHIAVCLRQKQKQTVKPINSSLSRFLSETLWFCLCDTIETVLAASLFPIGAWVLL